MGRPRPTLLDGGLATTLQSSGLPPGTSPSPWIEAHPDRLRAVHRAFVDAGADVLLTATLCASPRHLRGRPEDPDDPRSVAALNAAAVQLAREAADASPRPVRVAGSMGPLSLPGQLYDPHDPAVFRGLWAAWARSLGGADLLVLETFVDPGEALGALVAVRPVFDGPVVVSLCPRDDGRLYTGDDVGRWAPRLVSAGADVVGANCGTGPAGIGRAIRRMRETTNAPTWAKPNAGVPATLSADAWVDAARAIPATWVGGCCGVGPALLAALARAL